jgi:hypothetical protein
MIAIRRVLNAVRRWHRRRTIRDGAVLSQFVAIDVRREILVQSTARLEEGLITCRVRTINLLYLAHGHVTEPEFGPSQELRVDEMWTWTGQPWGGLADGTSIADHVPQERSE